MIKVENIDTWGFEHAIRGMRNPLNSWSRSDSYAGEPDCFENCRNCTLGEFFVGENDLKLMRQLYVGGQPHRKYLRQIFAVMDITAPLYWWKEFDTYKVGTTTNSCSTMHRLTYKPFEMSDFSFEHLIGNTTKEYYDVELSEEDYDNEEIEQMYRNGMTNQEIADAADCYSSAICNILNGRTYREIEMTPYDTAKVLVDLLNELRGLYLITKSKDVWWQMIQLLPSSYNQRRTVSMTYENVMNMLDYRKGHKLDEWREFCKILKQLPYVEVIRDGR